MGETGSLFPQILGALGATMGAFSLGTVIPWSSDASAYLQADETGHCKSEDDLDCLTDDEFSQVAAIMNIGAAIVPFVTIFLFPRIGKKWTMILLVIPFILGWVLIIVATEAWLFDIGRVLTGFSGGAFALAAPAYSNEIAEQRIRGALGTLMQLMLCIGILFILLLAKLHWKTVSGICIAFPALLGVWLFFMPRTPVFLVQKNKIEEARKSLQFYRKKKDVEEELKQIQAEVEEQMKIGTVSPVQLFTEGVYLKPFLISLSLMAFQQLSGVNFVNGYVSDIFRDSGSTIDEYLSSVLVGVTQVVGVLLAVGLVDRFGRKILLAASGFFMCISHLLLGVFFTLKNHAEGGGTSEETTTPSSVTASTSSLPETLQLVAGAVNSTFAPTLGAVNSTFAPALLASAQAFQEQPGGLGVTQDTVDNLGWLPLVSLLMFMAFFNIGFGPLPWVMNVELFASEARVPAAAMCGTFNWLCSYMVVFVTPKLQEAASPEFCYFLFCGICFLGLLFVIFITPETKGKSEEDMRNYFKGKK